uniref:uncharacterized protein n=1 Tax=Lonchura striata TaxID=40157 RepID=UPI000B4D0204|nr:uncharacterized protein LOC110471408 [Lonchura striata domestica]
MLPRTAAAARPGCGAAGAPGPPARGAAAAASWSRRGPACPPITGSAATAARAATSRPRTAPCPATAPTTRTRCPPTPATSSLPSAPPCRCTGTRSSPGPRCGTAARAGGRRCGAAGTRRAPARTGEAETEILLVQESMAMEKCHTFYLYKLTLASSLRSCGGSGSRRGSSCSTRAPTARLLLLPCSTGAFTRSQAGLRQGTRPWGPRFISPLRSPCLRACSTAVTPTLRPCRASPSRSGLQPSCALVPTSNINSATQICVLKAAGILERYSVHHTITSHLWVDFMNGNLLQK